MHVKAEGNMDDRQSTIATTDHDGHHLALKLDLRGLPPVYVLAAHLSIDEQHEAEDALSDGGASLTYDIKEANIVLGNISKARRAKSELLWKGVRVEDVEHKPNAEKSAYPLGSEKRSPAKKLRKLGDGNDGTSPRKVEVVIDDSSMASETEDDAHASSKPVSHSSDASSSNTIAAKDTPPLPIFPESCTNRVNVIKLDWLNDSLSAGKILPLGPYTIYTGRPIGHGEPATNGPATMKFNGLEPFAGNKSIYVQKEIAGGIIERATSDPKLAVSRYMKRDRIKDAANKDFIGKSFSSSTQAVSQESSRHITRPTHLLHQTTSEHDEAGSSSLPPMPDWVRENKIYACERATPLVSPNQAFICQLEKIKLARLLTLDEIGGRAYSSSIASIAAYPYPIQGTREILALPSCDQKIAHLFHEYQTNNGKLQAVTDLEADPALQVLREFNEIWGVGAKTARDFYYDKGWRDLNDIIELGWKSLSRVQQIGLKYYDEFMLKIPRLEVESIAAEITKHACLVTNNGIITSVVGGYRRGKPECGDVDLILSHQNQAMTYNLVDKVIKSLEKEGWITHTLTLNLTNTKRNQEPLPISTATVGGHGFDTLDKALVVWQDPDWPTKTADLKADPKAKNPNPHRRVDIIISPWRTVGCAVAGWTSDTTFQRDLRRYAKQVKGWKFDSSKYTSRNNFLLMDTVFESQDSSGEQFPTTLSQILYNQTSLPQ